MAIVARENGIDIDCDETGRFSAKAYGQYFQDRSLAKVKKWTASVKPNVELMHVDSDRLYTIDRGFHVIPNIVDVRVDTNGKAYGVTPSSSGSSRSRYQSYEQAHYGLFVSDKDAQDRINDLNDQMGVWKKELKDRYNKAFDEIVATLVPITPELFAELVEKKNRGDAGDEGETVSGASDAKDAQVA